MEISVFTDKNQIPSDADLRSALGSTYERWQTIRERVLEKYPAAQSAWSHSGAKYGWNFRMKDRKRAILYLLPRDAYFKVAFVFGARAVDSVLGDPSIAEDLKRDLEAAVPYAEGRGIRIDVRDDARLRDIERLIDIKLAH